jgi:transcriptional regulator with XRE-family HTH domain
MTLLGRKIESRRVELGLTNAQVARRMGFSEARLSALKRQEATGLSGAVLKRLADVLGMNPLFLLPDTPNDCASSGVEGAA